ncbi:GNAT superfamily N-acetyltransferase [Bradyrhizobium japonicum]
MTDNSTPQRTPRSVIDNISDTARQFVITKRPHHDHHHRRNVTEVRFDLPGKFLMGAREEEPGYLILLHIGASHHEHQRKGYGVACLERAIMYAGRQQAAVLCQRVPDARDLASCRGDAPQGLRHRHWS